MELLEEKLETKVNSEQLLQRLYKPGFYAVAAYVSRQGGNYDDARDTFHDGLEVLFNDLITGKKIDDELPYLIGVCRNIWNKRKQKSKFHTSLEGLDLVKDDDHHIVSSRRLVDLLSRTGKRCLDLLAAFYYDKANVGGLMKKFGFASEHSASVQKYKCIEKLREAVRTKSLQYEDFFE